MKDYAFPQLLCFVNIVALVVGLSGCVTIPGKGQSKYHFILGFGIVAVSDPQQTAMVATDVHSLGVMISDRPDVKLAIGYVSSAVVTVAEGAEDVRAEITRKPWGPLIVDTQRAVLQGESASMKEKEGGKNEKREQ
ncbi:MAG: hypothetical protein AB7P69_05945 [Candidatus Binatia bacterium]